MLSDQENYQQLARKKAYEICYAILRVSLHNKSRFFRERLENRAFLLLESVVLNEYQDAVRTLEVIDWFLQLASDIGTLHQSNYQVIKQELDSFLPLLRYMASSYGEVDLENIFSSSEKYKNQAGVSGKKGGASYARNADHKEKENNIAFSSVNLSESSGHGSQLSESGGGRNIYRAIIRQSAILERLRQNSNLPDVESGCRLKEIQDVLPQVSERTIRYDLQNLIERGEVERIGKGGPATFYKAKT